MRVAGSEPAGVGGLPAFYPLTCLHVGAVFSADQLQAAEYDVRTQSLQSLHREAYAMLLLLLLTLLCCASRDSTGSILRLASLPPWH